MIGARLLQTHMAASFRRGGLWSPPASLLAWWASNNLTSGMWSDLSGNGHDGTLGGDAAIDADGLTLDASGDYVNIGTMDLSAVSGFSGCAWVRRTATGFGGIFGASGGARAMEWIFWNSASAMALNTSDGWKALTLGTVCDGTWHHVGFAFGEDTSDTSYFRLRMYLDGTYVAASTGLTHSVYDPSPTNAKRLGVYNGNTYTTNAEIDDMMLFSAQLADADFADIRANSPWSHA